MPADIDRDVAIIGAGLAGLSCAQVLQAAGYSVVLLEKSRGVGGRVATRHARDTRIDHGLPFFWDQGPLTRKLIAAARAENLLQPWPPERDNYCSPAGNSEIGRFLARNLDVRLQHVVAELAVTEGRDPYWQLACADKPAPFQAKALAIAIPAPQVAALLRAADLNPPPTGLLPQLDAVRYDPCITVMAEYGPEAPLPNWQALNFEGHALLQWIGLDSSKRERSSRPIFVLHSSPEFAERHLNATDLDAVAGKLLEVAATTVPFPFRQPNWFQIHRWRYAVPKRFLQAGCLSAFVPLPVVCCGDWCAGNTIEAALASGQAAGRTLQTALARSA